LISHHHGQLSNLKTEYDVLTKLLTISDRISASEREEQQTFSERKTKLMRSIISSVSLKGETKPPYYKPISRFSKFESLLDKDQAEEYDHEEDYERLWKEFEELISQGDLLHSYEDKEKRYLFFERIYHLLKEYTSNIPSAYYYSEPNVSLFSHAVSTAAIAISLFKQFEDELFKKSNDRFVSAEEKFNSIERLMRSYGSSKNNQPLPDDEPVLGIIKGDVSGIQNFHLQRSKCPRIEETAREILFHSLPCRGHSEVHRRAGRTLHFKHPFLRRRAFLRSCSSQKRSADSTRIRKT
jgi:CRISPR-associated protein Csm1